MKTTEDFICGFHRRNNKTTYLYDALVERHLQLHAQYA